MRKKKPLERRTYRRRLIRNGILCLLLVLVLWIVNGYPLPQSMMLRQLERRMLLEPSTIVLETDDNQQYPHTLVLGVTEDHIHAFDLWKTASRLIVWDRKGEEPTLVVLPRQVGYWTGEEKAYAPMLAAADVPQEAVSARLTMTLTYDGVINHSPAQWEQVYTIEGVRDGSCFLFQLTYQGEPDGTTLEELAEQSWMRSTPSHWTEAVQQNQISYTLEFFDADGQVILTQTNP